MDQIDVKIGEFEGYSAHKVAGDEADVTYVAIGRENACDRDKGIAIVDMSDTGLHVVGTDGFHDAIHKLYKELKGEQGVITDVSGFRKIAIEYAATELTKNPDKFLKVLALARASGIEYGDRLAKEKFREAIGL